jgi:signal transduction histidine kinase
MATVKRNINFLVSNSNTLSSQQILQKMQALESVSTQINQELRDTIWATQHEHMTAQDFITRLKSFVFQTLGPDSPIKVHYSEHVDDQAIFGPFVTLNLHRICQEALHNIVKHSEASDIYLNFESKDQLFIVTIRDNGKGFDPAAVYEGYGLQNMRLRASSIAADLKWTTTPGSGATISIAINRLALAGNNT